MDTINFLEIVTLNSHLIFAWNFFDAGISFLENGVEDASVGDYTLRGNFLDFILIFLNEIPS